MTSRREPSSYVLLIESDPQETELYSELIQEIAPCKIDVVSPGQDSLDRISPSNYHLILADLSSIGTASEEIALLEKIKRLSPGTSVIAISDHASVEQAVAAVRLGTEDYLQKPVQIDALKLAIKRSLDRKTVFGDQDGAASYVTLINSCQMISASMEETKIFEILQSYFQQELHSSYSAVYRFQPGGPIRIETEAESESPKDQALDEILDIAVSAVNPFKRMQEADLTYQFFDKGQLTPAMFVFRFRCVAETDLFCVCLSPKKPKLLTELENRLGILRRQAEVSGNTVRQYQGVQQLVYMDDATGLFNTRYLNDMLEKEISLAQASQKSFAVLFIDADHFKSVNDKHGHLVGTKLLNELGEQIKRFVRANDVVFRYGGDEFVAVLKNCDLRTAKSVAERIRSGVETNSFLASESLDIRFTVSIGVAMFPQHAISKREIIEIADRAMYEAKRSSRNSVVVLPPKGAAPARKIS